KEKVTTLDTKRFPVESVSWHDAQDFCDLLNQKYLAKLPDPLKDSKYRFHLPTEAQWEYACRAGTTTPFHFGDVCDGNQANCNGNFPFGTNKHGPSLGRPTRVDGEGELHKYPANKWGLYDMHGNVWQWCADAYEKDFYKKHQLEIPLNRGEPTC